MRFVVRSDVFLNPEYGRSAIRAERPILIPSVIRSVVFVVFGTLYSDRLRELYSVYPKVNYPAKRPVSVFEHKK